MKADVCRMSSERFYSPKDPHFKPDGRFPVLDLEFPFKKIANYRRWWKRALRNLFPSHSLPPSLSPFFPRGRRSKGAACFYDDGCPLKKPPRLINWRRFALRAGFRGTYFFSPTAPREQRNNHIINGVSFSPARIPAR